jgi:hypothetical protein
MLDNLLSSCLNIVCSTVDMLCEYKVYVLNLLAIAAVSVIFSQNRRLALETNVVSCSCKDAAVAAFVSNVYFPFLQRWTNRCVNSLWLQRK